jgi:hypothetical protein
MKRGTGWLTLCVVVALCGNALADPTTQDILRQADQARGNLEGITWEVVLESVEKKRTESMTLDVTARQFDIRAETLAPPKSKGNKLLMLSGNMWFYKPGLSKPVPVSQRQRLLGKAAYGDIAATNYAEDYEATRLGEEEVNGKLAYVFDLQAKDGKKTTYDRIKYWISKDPIVGVKADYFTVSGKKFKSAMMEYTNTVLIRGQARPFISRVIIHGELMSSDVTTLTLSEPNFQQVAPYLFNLNLLTK